MTEDPDLGTGPEPGPAAPLPEFYDAIKYWLIPDAARAALYRDGMYACPPGEATRLGPVRWITIAADYRNCGITDYEEGNPVFDVPGLLREFVAGRLGMRKRARVYCDRVNMSRAAAELDGLPFEWWIATLDGDKLGPGFAPNLWAVQFEGGPRGQVDKSALYGPW